jgi:hypothetical protein
MMNSRPTLAALLTGLSATSGAWAAAPAETTTVGATLFLDATHIDQDSTATSGVTTHSAASGTGVDVKRGYLIVNHVFDDTWSANVTTDFSYSASTGQTQLFIKNAWVQAKLADAFAVRAGASALPWIPFVEGQYGFRFVEKLLIDRLNFGTTTDWGVHASGKAGGSVFNYAVSAVNGGGFRNPTRTAKLDFEGRISFVPVAGLTLAVGGYSGERGTKVAGAAFAPQHTAQRLDAFASWVQPAWRVGIEYFNASDWNRLALQAAPVAGDHSDGYSVWASAKLAPQFEAFARYDSARPSTDLAPALKDEYFNLGIDYKARKNVDIALAYKYDKVKGGSHATANGTIGGTREGEYKEFGVWGLVAF